MSQKFLGPDFDKWTSQWEKAQASGIFGEAPKAPARPAADDDFFGNHRPTGDTTIHDVDADYWRSVYGLSSNSGSYVDPLAAAEVLTEQRKEKKAKKKKSDLGFTAVPSPVGADGVVKAKVTMITNDPNPQLPSGFGRDGVDGKTGLTQVSPGLAADRRLPALNSLKLALYDLECKMSSATGLSDEKVKSVEKKARSIQKQIDDLSNDVCPKYPDSHL